MLHFFVQKFNKKKYPDLCFVWVLSLFQKQELRKYLPFDIVIEKQEKI